MIDPRPTFALIGAAGYIAPRHLDAIRAVGGSLVAAVDPFDSVGILDRYFPATAFFTEFERFDRHLEKLKRQGSPVDYIVVCSPNYLHDAHCRFGLRYGADVICEKPTVLNPWNLDALAAVEAETGRKINTILQLRLHPTIRHLREVVRNGATNAAAPVLLSYISARGNWYYTSWKGDITKSGGIASNIGIHFFDMLLWVFGGVRTMRVHRHQHDRAAGFLQLDRAEIRWFLSIAADTLPDHVRQSNGRTFRQLDIDGQAFDFTAGFTELHKASYEQILAGNGFGLDEARPSIELVQRIREAVPVFDVAKAHPLAHRGGGQHPFQRHTKLDH